MPWTPPSRNGVAYVSRTNDGGQTWKVVHSAISGYADHRYAAPLRERSQFRLGSNSKFFTAVALYQLQERGLLNVSEPVTSLLDATDYAKFGRPNVTTWCPKLVSAGPADNTCHTPTVEQLLSMSSGIIGIDNCLAALPHAPEALLPWCQRAYADYPYISMYGGNKALYFARFFDAPLLFEPGTLYSYANTNFVLAAYLVEKLSGQSLGDYLRQHVFAHIGLNDTYYDQYDGQLQYHPDLAGEYREWVADDTGAHLGLGECGTHMSPGSFAGAAGVRSTVVDFHTWWQAVMRSDWNVAPALGLSASSFRELLRPRAHVGSGIYFAQGMQVVPSSTPGAFPTEVLYCGESFCTMTCNILATAPGGQGQLMVSAWTSHEVYNVTPLLYTQLQHYNDYSVPLGPLSLAEAPWFSIAPQANLLGQYRTSFTTMNRAAQELLRDYRPGGTPPLPLLPPSPPPLVKSTPHTAPVWMAVAVTSMAINGGLILAFAAMRWYSKPDTSPLIKSSQLVHVAGDASQI